MMGREGGGVLMPPLFSLHQKAACASCGEHPACARTRRFPSHTHVRVAGATAPVSRWTTCNVRVTHREGEREHSPLAPFAETGRRRPLNARLFLSPSLPSTQPTPPGRTSSSDPLCWRACWRKGAGRAGRVGRARSRTPSEFCLFLAGGLAAGAAEVERERERRAAPRPGPPTPRPRAHEGPSYCTH